MPNSKRYRSKEHMAVVKSHGCCICRNPVADAHHLRIVGHKRGMSVKNGDDYTIPLCRRHHDELHAFGDESLFLALNGINVYDLLTQLRGGRHGLGSDGRDGPDDIGGSPELGAEGARGSGAREPEDW